MFNEGKTHCRFTRSISCGRINLKLLYAVSCLLKKLLSYLTPSRSVSKLSLIDSMIAGSFFIGAIGLGLIWWLV